MSFKMFLRPFSSCVSCATGGFLRRTVTTVTSSSSGGCRVLRPSFNFTARRFFGAQTITKGQDLLEDDEMKSSIKAFGDTSFLINNVIARQSVILLPNSFLLWNVKRVEDLTVDNLSVFAAIFPTIEVLFLGCGKSMPRQLPEDITAFFKSKGIVIEASNTVNAASTFNVLNLEGRNVAAALLTLEPYNDLMPL
jgi:uncharacterized protein